MAKKRVKKVSKKKVRSTGKKIKSVRSTGRKISLAVKNLIFFAILFALSVVLYSACSNELYLNLFYLLAIIFGFIGLAFLIVLLVLVFLRMLSK